MNRLGKKQQSKTETSGKKVYSRDSPDKAIRENLALFYIDI